MAPKKDDFGFEDVEAVLNCAPAIKSRLWNLLVQQLLPTNAHPDLRPSMRTIPREVLLSYEEEQFSKLRGVSYVLQTNFCTLKRRLRRR